MTAGVRAPQHTIACTMLDKMRAFAIELGLTPAARKRLGRGSKANGDNKPNPLAGLRVVRNQATP